jgi:fumarate reductase subunit D
VPTPDHPRAGEESPRERVNRELIELLNEVRVALPGVQVLFAFLLAVPFQQRFARATIFERDTYFATLACAFVACALFIAPSAAHRLNFRQHDKRKIVLVSNTLIILGIAVLGTALVGVLVLVTDVLFAPPVVAIASGSGAVMLIAVWVVLPWRLRREAQRSHDEGAHDAAPA